MKIDRDLGEELRAKIEGRQIKEVRKICKSNYLSLRDYFIEWNKKEFEMRIIEKHRGASKRCEYWVYNPNTGQYDSNANKIMNSEIPIMKRDKFLHPIIEWKARFAYLSMVKRGIMNKRK